MYPAYRPRQCVNDLLSVKDKDTGVMMAFLDQKVVFILVDHNIILGPLIVAWWSYLSNRNKLRVGLPR